MVIFNIIMEDYMKVKLLILNEMVKELWFLVMVIVIEDILQLIKLMKKWVF